VSACGPAEALARAMSSAPEGPLGVAVSGGGDSLALLLLLQASGRSVEAVTVDHGLRPEAAVEAEAVARLCAERGIPHATLRWQGWTGRGNLQAAARAARRRLIAAWARERGLGAVALGHTLEDQAETFLLRLARGSGVDGLAAMGFATRGEGLLWLRPLLEARRADLRAWLAGQGVPWAEDPSNADPAFARVRARAALDPLATLGLAPERLASAAAAMARARAALEAATGALARACLAAGPAGDLTLDPAPWRSAPEEIRLRLLAAALGWVSGAPLRPRLAALTGVAGAIAAGRVTGLTLHGCVLRAKGERVVLRREPERVGQPVPFGAIWDARWSVTGPCEGAEIAALGTAGLAARPLWRDSGLAREALLTTPGVWRDGALRAAPILDGPPFALRRVCEGPAPWELGRPAGPQENSSHV
jgi:tRNA(Ile)-lysidine synthase